MKLKIFTALIFLYHLNLNGQTELVNVYSTYSAMHGGMATSGVSESAKYTFVAKEKITLSHVTFNGTNLILEKGDTLIISTSSYTPYQNNYLAQQEDDEEIDTIPVKTQENFAAYKTAKRTYTLGFSMHAEFSKAVTYLYKDKAFVATIKSEFDEYQKHYAP